MDAFADHVEVTAAFARELEALGVRYVIGGSIAASFWAQPRATADSDFAVDLDSVSVGALVSRLEEGWYVDPELAAEAVRRCGFFNVVHLEPFVKIDVFVPPNEGIHPNKWDRARRVDFAGSSVAVTSPEDIVLQDLDWYRRGGEVAQQQLADSIRVLQEQGDRIDDAYLDEWAERIGVADLLKRVRATARPPDAHDV
jgi:hypothetical protein